MASGLNRDTAIGMLGAAVLIAAMAGVFFYERSQFDTYDVDWSQQEAGSDSASGTLDEGGSNSHAFTADGERLSQVTVTLSWSDDAGQPDTLELIVQGPNGTYSDSAEGSSSPLEVEIPIRDEPGPSTTTARSLEDARDQLNETATWTNGTGEWSVTVALLDAPGDQTPVGEDGSQEYDVSFTYDRWEPALQPRG